MPFSQSERDALLAVKGVGATVVQRLEEMGFSTLSQLAHADPAEIVKTAAKAVGSSCWKNSPQARTAIDSAIKMAKACAEA